jgi:mannose-6-phosphate isomerase-like protein (cupin superfamily)
VAERSAATCTIRSAFLQGSACAVRAVRGQAIAHCAAEDSMTNVVSPADIAAGLTEYWAPRVIAELDDCYVKVAKVKGSLVWHAHDAEDELFYVLAGTLRIEMEAHDVVLGTGDCFVVPKGVRHNPVAEEECHVMLIERKSTLHTGDVATERTRSIAEQLRGQRYTP